MAYRFKKFYAAFRPDILKELLPAVRVYDLRHRFATAVRNKWLDEKIDINAQLPYLQAYMGHKNISSTAYYIPLLSKRKKLYRIPERKSLINRAPEKNSV